MAQGDDGWAKRRATQIGRSSHTMILPRAEVLCRAAGPLLPRGRRLHGTCALLIATAFKLDGYKGSRRVEPKRFILMDLLRSGLRGKGVKPEARIGIGFKAFSQYALLPQSTQEQRD